MLSGNGKNASELSATPFSCDSHCDFSAYMWHTFQLPFFMRKLANTPEWGTNFTYSPDVSPKPLQLKVISTQWGIFRKWFYFAFENDTRHKFIHILKKTTGRSFLQLREYNNYFYFVYEPMLSSSTQRHKQQRLWRHLVIKFSHQYLIHTLHIAQKWLACCTFLMIVTQHVSVVERFGIGLVIERSLVRLPAGALSSEPGQLSLPSLWSR